MRERGLYIDHRTIYRRVQQYAPELERRCRPHLTGTNDSWRVDETYVRVKKVWMYLYRAVDSRGEYPGISAQSYQRFSSSQTFLRQSACCASYQHTSRHHRG
jgi:transposase-like protein